MTPVSQYALTSLDPHMVRINVFSPLSTVPDPPFLQAWILITWKTPNHKDFQYMQSPAAFFRIAWYLLRASTNPCGQVKQNSGMTLTFMSIFE